MLPVTKKKKLDTDSHFTFLTTPASPIILGCDNFFENRKEEDETEVATEAEREREEVQCSEWDRDQLSTCPQIIRCLEEDHSVENGEKFYNVFLEYASGGSLADQVKNRGGSLPESDVRRYAKSILLGLREIHAKRFVHCDIKLQNILMFGNGAIKIADFGLAKRAEQKQSTEEKRAEVRGTPLYMSPESVNKNEYESPVDIWALGCTVVEMVTGKPAWNWLYT